MEDKIEVNEYVRTRAGHIYKITNIDENGLIYWNKIQCGWSEQQLEDIIVKHSKQLIDLIEVGDIVNKELVIGIIDITNDKEERVDRKLITQYRSAQFTGLDIRYYIYDYDIKTILTRESYMANCYKVGGE